VELIIRGQKVGWYDAFILKFTNTGERAWATYYGGSGSDGGISITTDGSGDILVTGLLLLHPISDPESWGDAYYQGYLQDLGMPLS
jgi:hypothetical protein